MFELKRKTKNKKTKLVGRGSKRGKTSGRGTKGQKARAGHKIRPHIRDMIKKLPKLRGRGKNINKAFRTDAVVVNLGAIAKSFTDKSTITAGKLFEKGLIRRVNGVLPKVKVLATGDITSPINLSGLLVSASAKAKIEKAGGSVR